MKISPFSLLRSKALQIEKHNFYILTGGSGSGKTTLIDALRRVGHGCVAEVARPILQAQRLSGGNATHDGDQVKYRDLMFEPSVETFQAMAEEKAPVFFDRGLPDLIGYCDLIGTAVPEDLAEAISNYRYNATVFIAPPWPEIYVHDAERKQGFEEAIQTYEVLVKAYGACGYRLVELPKVSVPERLAFLLARVA
jgi:predicted ATPase